MQASRFANRKLPESVRRRLEVATAMAWEALVDTHTTQAGQFVELLKNDTPLEEALALYLVEMDLVESVASAVRTRVLVAMEGRLDDGGAPDGADAEAAPEREAGGDSWLRFRPGRVMNTVRRWQRRHDEFETRVSLALARAEEAIINTHVENAITFAALLEEHMPLEGAVQNYIAAVNLTGGRAQAVHQRTMARLADVHLPVPRTLDA